MNGKGNLNRIIGLKVTVNVLNRLSLPVGGVVLGRVFAWGLGNRLV